MAVSAVLRLAQWHEPHPPLNVRQIANGEMLAARHRDHALIGSRGGSRDCHIEPDWLLIYRKEEDSLYLERSGTHSDLFKK